MMSDRQIVLGGNTFKIPELAIRQMMVIFPLMDKIPQELKAAGFNPLKMPPQVFDDIMTVVAAAVQKAQPEITKDMLLDMPLKLNELVVALAIISSQCGMVPTSGEAPGGATASPTGAT